MLVYVINSHGCISFIIVILLTVYVRYVLIIIMLCSSHMYLWSWCISFMVIVDLLMSFVCRVLINTSHVPLICSGGCFFLYKYHYCNCMFSC